MKTEFFQKRISAMLGIIPVTESFFDDEVSNYDFPVKQTMRLKKIMGYEKHRLAKETSTVFDFAEFGLSYIIEHDWIRKKEIGAIIVVTLCPDYYVPHISTMLQGRFGLSEDVLCLDIAQGCCGFIVGIIEAFLLLEHIPDKKILLVNGDVLSRKISRKDRNDFPLTGDAVTITILENDKNTGTTYCEMYMDGSRGDALKIPAGGFRIPSTDETGILMDQGDGNFRALNHMHMDGSGVFNFVQTEVPPLIENLLEYSGETKESIDYFFFHQPNRFMLKKLADKAEISYDKMPMNLVENFGNSSGATIPMTILLNYCYEIKMEQYKCCLSAFGSGLAWGGAVMDIGRLTQAELVEAEL